MGDELAVRARVRNKLLRTLNATETNITNSVRAFADGFDVTLSKKELETLQEGKAETETRLTEIDNKEMTKPMLVVVSDILESYRNPEKALQTQDNSTKRKMLRYFVHRLEFDLESYTLTF